MNNMIRNFVQSLILVSLIILVVVLVAISYGGPLVPSFINSKIGQEIQHIPDLILNRQVTPPTTPPTSPPIPPTPPTTPPTSPTKPNITISNDTVNWYFSDSKGNPYHWTYPLSDYDAIVSQPIYVPTYSLQLLNGQSVTTYDYREFAKEVIANHEFSHVIDEVYDNAGSDGQFIYEVSYIVSEITTYSKDITDNNLWPVEVLTRGEGDCKDKSILIADMLRSSSHTANWNIKLTIMDMDNPSNPQTVNHMIVFVDTGQSNYAIEPTATTEVNALNVWAGVTIHGWDIPV